MIRPAYITGRILAALGAILMVASLAVTAVSMAGAGSCDEADCDDVIFSHAMERFSVFVPTSILVGAAGVLLVNVTYRKI